MSQQECLGVDVTYMSNETTIENATAFSHEVADKITNMNIIVSTYSLNGTGHTTYTWKKDNVDSIIPAIQKAMDEGHTFFIIKPRLAGLLSPEEKPLTSAEAARKAKAVSGNDGHFADLVASGVVTAIVSQPSNTTTVERAKTAEEAATHDTVSVKPSRGG